MTPVAATPPPATSLIALQFQPALSSAFPCRHPSQSARIASRFVVSMPIVSLKKSGNQFMKPEVAGASAFKNVNSEQDGDDAPVQERRINQFGHILNVSSRWVVVAIVIAVVAWRHDDQVIWAVTGGILNAGNSKLLKKIFNQQRPLTALGSKADPGMPSSHAQSLGYLGLYAALGLISWQGLHILTVSAAIMILLCAAYLAWLRISQGLHTPAQVIVGAGFGCAMAGLWLWLWHLFVQEAVASSHTVHYFLYSVFGFAVICFLILGVRKWRFGDA